MANIIGKHKEVSASILTDLMVTCPVTIFALHAQVDVSSFKVQGISYKSLSRHKTYVPAAEPCLSPLESFLKAYETLIGRLLRYWPFIASIAASDAAKLAKLMKAKPLELPVSGSRMI